MILDHLRQIWLGNSDPFLLTTNQSLSYNEIISHSPSDIDNISRGDVVALIGDFDTETISSLLHLLESGAIVVPLTNDTTQQHEYFIQESLTQYVFHRSKLIKILSKEKLSHPLFDSLRCTGDPGIILFTTGTTGKPKAILHNFYRTL